MNDKKEHCHYSGLPSPSAYAKDNIDYDGMGNQGRVPSIKESDRKDSIIIFSFNYTYPICKVETKVVMDFDDALSLHKKNLKLGYEGSIYRSFAGKYKGYRS